MSTWWSKIRVAKETNLSSKLNTFGENTERKVSEENLYPFFVDFTKVNGGAGVACYFTFLQNIIIFLLVGSIFTIVMCVLYALCYNIYKEPERTSVGFSEFLLWISPANFIKKIWLNGVNSKVQTAYILQLIPVLLFFATLLVGFHVTESKLPHIQKINDRNFITAADYSLEVNGFSEDKNAKDIYDFFKTEVGVNVHSVLVLKAGMRDYIKHQKKLNKAVIEYNISLACSQMKKDALVADPAAVAAARSLQRCRSFRLTPKERCVRLTHRETTGEDDGCLCCCGCCCFGYCFCGNGFTRALRSLGLKKDIIYYENQVRKHVEKRERALEKQKGPYPSVAAFVTFTLSKDTDNIATKALRFEDQPLVLTPNVEPEDVVFSNYNPTSYWQRTTLVNIGMICTGIIIIAAGIVAEYFFNKLKETQYVDVFAYDRTTSGLSFALSGILSFLTFLAGKIITKLSKLRLGRTKTDQIVTDTYWTILISQIVTTYGPFVASLFQSVKDPADTNSSSWYFMSYQWYNLVAVNFVTNILVDSAVIVLVEGLHPLRHLLVVIPAWFRASYLKEDELCRDLSPPKWNLNDRIADLSTTFFIGVIVSPLMPITIPLLLVYVLLHYLIDRHHLLRWCKSPIPYSIDAVANLRSAFLESVFMCGLFQLLTFLFIVRSNYPSAPFVLYVNLLVYAIIFAAGMLFTAARVFLPHLFCGAVDSSVSPPDETLGIPFINLENDLENYIDLHPCCREEELLFGGDDKGYGANSEDEETFSSLFTHPVFSGGNPNVNDETKTETGGTIVNTVPHKIKFYSYYTCYMDPRVTMPAETIQSSLASRHPRKKKNTAVYVGEGAEKKGLLRAVAVEAGKPHLSSFYSIHPNALPSSSSSSSSSSCTTDSSSSLPTTTTAVSVSPVYPLLSDESTTLSSSPSSVNTVIDNNNNDNNSTVEKKRNVPLPKKRKKRVVNKKKKLSLETNGGSSSRRSLSNGGGGKRKKKGGGGGGGKKKKKERKEEDIEGDFFHKDYKSTEGEK